MHYFFDAVGTVLFPTPTASVVYAQVAARHGLTLDPDAVRSRLWAQFRLEEAADRAAGWTTSEARERDRWRKIVLAAVPAASDELFDELYQHFAQPHAWTVPPTAAECIARLHARGLKLGLASNYDSRLLNVLAGTPELHPLRERVVVSSLVGYRKPAAEFFAEVVRAAGCAADEITFVGDDPENDFDGARAARMHAVLLDPDDKHTDRGPRVKSLLELLVL
jgi:putative hydrolase of the HAD superfamily